jgi:hypothetical protein
MFTVAWKLSMIEEQCQEKSCLFSVRKLQRQRPQPQKTLLGDNGFFRLEMSMTKDWSKDQIICFGMEITETKATLKTVLGPSTGKTGFCSSDLG